MSVTTHHLRQRPFVTVAAHRPQRWIVAVFAAVAAAAHIPVTGPHLVEAPYMGALFIALTVSCFALALALVIRDAPLVYAAVVVICGLALIGYAATRLVAFPMLGDDVGNWFEPLGVVSVVTEAIAVIAAVSALVSVRSGASAES